MFKKLAITASCVCCFALSASDSPFITLGETTMNDIIDSVGQKPMLSSPANLPGYVEVYLKSESYRIEDDKMIVAPVIVKGFKNIDTNTIDAIAVEYQADILRQLITDLGPKYPMTYARNKLSGTAEIEFLNKDRLIRIIKSGEHTLLMHGTIKWFNVYDKSRGQVEEIKDLRRANRAQYKQEQQPNLSFNAEDQEIERPRHVGDPKPYQKHEEAKMYEPPRHVGDPKPMYRPKDTRFKDRRYRKQKRHPNIRVRTPFKEFESFFDFDKFDKVFEEFDNDDFFNIRMPKIDRPMKNYVKETDNGKEYVKSYSFSQNYSKNGDIEKLKRNDNGDVTEIFKTPEEVTVTHNGETQTMSPQEFKNFDISSGKIKNSLEPAEQNINLSVDTPDRDEPKMLVVKTNIEPNSELSGNTSETIGSLPRNTEEIAFEREQQNNCPICPIFSDKKPELKPTDSVPVIRHCPPPPSEEFPISDQNFSKNAEDDNEFLLYGRE